MNLGVNLGINSITSLSAPVFANRTQSKSKTSENAIKQPIENNFKIPANDTTSAERKFGYEIDKDGFMSFEFHIATGIPLNVKIHHKTAELITNYAKAEKLNLSPVEAVSKAWNFFKQYASNSIDVSGNSLLTQANLEKMPISFNHTGNIFGSVLKTYYNSSDERDAFVAQSRTYRYSNYQMDTGFSFGMGCALNANMERLKYFYEDTATTSKLDSDRTDIGEVFHVFIDNEAYKASFIHQKGKTRSELVKNYYEFLQSGKSIKEFMDGISPDYYKNHLNNYCKYVGVDVGAGRFDAMLKMADECNKNFYEANKNFIDKFVKFDKFGSTKNIFEAYKISVANKGVNLVNLSN